MIREMIDERERNVNEGVYGIFAGARIALGIENLVAY
jgi:hypothetical protein